MKFSAASQIRKTDNFIQTMVDDEIVLMHFVNGRFYSLKDTGRRAWELLGVHSRLGDVVTALRQEYDVSEHACLTELQTMLENLENLNLITVS